MRRATITIPDDLAADLDAFLADQEPKPSLTRLMQAALRRFLEEKRREQALKRREVLPARRPLAISVAAQGSGERQVSIDHDRYLAGEE